ncbi:MAG: flagellar type secretion system protein FlhB [Pseudomonadota bacterium]|jgi:flagellar biosynthetic protein FlhB
MAEESDAEKTEPASERRLEQAREEGDVPRSRELTTFAVLMTSGIGMWLWGGRIVAELNRIMIASLSLPREQVFDAHLLYERVLNDVVQLMLVCIPVGLAIMLAALASPMAIGGWLFSGKAVMPNFGRLNPLKGIGNLFSKNSLVELIKALVKTLIVGSIAWVVIMAEKDQVVALAVEPLKQAIMHAGHLMIVTFLAVASGLALIALIDGPYQLWHYADKLKMTRQEVIQEAKESDGNPQIKGRIRQLQREMARKRMMAAVPTADVVVTNPTHYAVALKYAEGKMGAPQVVAKGMDEVAAKIRELAKENNVAMLEAPPLARALYKHTEIGDEIPQALYTAVAEVLAYVFQLRMFTARGGVRPVLPKDIEVPPQMDPLNPAAEQAKAAKLDGAADPGPD